MKASTDVAAAGSSMIDHLKIVVAGLLVVAGLFGFYWFSNMPLVVRVLMVLGGLAAGAVVGWLSAPGQQFAAFGRESVAEVKKVVWPTRKESMQTAAAVFAFVVLMALFLWAVDKTLEWGLYDLILGWKK